MNEHYELTYIVSIKYLENDLVKVGNQVKEILKEATAEITKEEDLGKRKLAYPIKHIHQGTYLVLEFDMPKENLKKVNDQLAITNEVLRHLIIKKKVRTAAEIAKEEAAKARLVKDKEKEDAKEAEETKEKIEKQEKAATETVKKEIAPSVEIASTKKDDKKSTLDDLDKKLDEILKDDVL
ncbi:30S ribosomal protein S6 [Candidatus Falkowbacteria bacterium]|jgi:small subunit ribosomal protein S6|nr:30S ribosomal protein S6 [Candidatus Falkowbacteria bacterium]MBT7007432.1 30S ribosomal protein S6 [Candidatus Falkowbacteria bacterium]